MYGFNSAEEARAAYLSNYEEGWHGLGNITPVSKEEFKKWIDSSHRKTKPFAEYAGVKIQDSGEGPFGLIFDQFKEKAKEAYNFLSRRKSGEARGVFHRDDIGYISLVWGDNKGGLVHIIDKHVGEGKSFGNIYEALSTIDNIIRNGKKVFDNGDKLVLSIGNKLVTIRKNYRENGIKKADMNWVLSAYDTDSADSGNSAMTATNKGKAAPATEPGNKDTKVYDNASNTDEESEKYIARKNYVEKTRSEVLTKQGYITGVEKKVPKLNIAKYSSVIRLHLRHFFAAR